MKRLFSSILLLLYCSSYVLSQDAPAHSSSEPPTASQEILDIADKIENIANKWDEHQNYLNQLTQDLETSMKDSSELRFTLNRMQETYDGLRNDYGILQVKLQRSKTISLVLGVSSLICAGSTILILILN